MLIRLLIKTALQDGIIPGATEHESSLKRRELTTRAIFIGRVVRLVGDPVLVDVHRPLVLSGVAESRLEIILVGGSSLYAAHRW